MSLPVPARIAALARHVIPGAPAADIGTDHGLLAVHLVLTGRVPRVIASDKAPSALDRARRKVATWAVQDRVDLRLGDGLTVLRPDDGVATVVVAGMGGRAVRRMLWGHPLEPVHGVERLICQVNRGRELLRDTLLGAGWHLLATENGPEQRWPWTLEVFSRSTTR